MAPLPLLAVGLLLLHSGVNAQLTCNGRFDSASGYQTPNPGPTFSSSWCCLAEDGTTPRGAIGVSSGGAVSSVCHVNGQGSTLPLGSTLPTNVYTNCPTADSWGTMPTQCMVPGYAYPSYPYTVDQRQSCNRVVYSADLADQNDPTAVYGRAYIWKDYQDVLYVTVSLNATIDATGGQYLYSQPSVTGGSAGSLFVWDTITSSMTTAYNDQMAAEWYNNQPRWSCFTYKVNLKQTCSPTLTTKATSGSGLAANSNSGCVCNDPSNCAQPFKDLSYSSDLLLYATFKVNRYSLAAPTPGASFGFGYECGSVTTPPVTTGTRAQKTQVTIGFFSPSNPSGLLNVGRSRACQSCAALG